MTGQVVVVGSANLDLTLEVPRRPDGGETLIGTSLTESLGGKGANQALAAARRARTAFVGCVGADPAGDGIANALELAGVDISRLGRGGVATGRAVITLTADRENSIIVLPLANFQLEPDAVLAALDDLAPVAVLTQCEVPDAITLAAAVWCDKNRVRFVLNPSPVRHIPAEVLAIADPLIVNQSEAQELLGSVSTDWQLLALTLNECSRSVVLTVGANGAFVASGGASSHVPGTEVVVVDTTGAGDAFAGTLTAYLAGGMDLTAAAALANAEAARIVQLARSAR
jgi:ribokinase